MEIEIYRNARGKSPLLDWLSGMRDNVSRLRIQQRIDRLSLEDWGDYRPLGGNLFELRLFFGPGYRVYFAEWEGRIIVLLNGGDKSSQRRDIGKAEEYWKDYKERMP